MSCTPSGTTTPVLGLCKPAQGETNWAAAMNGNMDTLDALLANNFAAGSSIALSVASGVLTITNTGGGTIVRSSLAGFTLSNDVTTPNSVIDIAAGQCADSTNASYISGSAFTKTTSVFAVGSGKGGLAPALTMTSSTWYHIFASVVSSSYDVFFDTSVSATNKPGGTTSFRRIGSFLTSATPNTNVMSFSQDGDYFRWYRSVLDVNANNPGTNAVTRTLTVPTGVQVQAIFNGGVLNVSNGGLSTAYFSDLAANDEAPAFQTVAAPLASTSLAENAPGGAESAYLQQIIRTNTSAQIRSRLSFSDANVTLGIATLGWIDRRGKDT